MDISVIVDGLAARMEELCRQLLPAGRRDGREWCVGSARGEPGQSCRICLSGAKRGVWSDFADDGSRGDALDLVAAVLFADDKRQALAWSRSWLGYDGGDARALAHTRRAVAEAAEAPQADQDDGEWAKWAMKVWLGARPVIRGTPAERYLKGRGIDLEGTLGRQPRALRFHPELWHRPSGRAWPALVAAINDGDGRHVAVHRIWLEARADGTVGKAPVTDPKMTLGRYRGGSIRLWKGADGKPLAKAPEGSTVVISEGIEDGLVLAMARPDLRYLASVSLSNMAAVVLPPAISTVVLYLDNDGDNAKAAKAVERAVAAHRAAGRRVCLARPSAEYKDANALLLDQRREAS